LHQQVVIGHHAVNTQRLERDPGIAFHRLQHFARLKGGRFENRAREMSAVDETGEADDGSASAVIPVRRVKPGERGDKVDAAVVRYRSRERLDIRALLDQSEVVADPLHERTGDRDAAFERVPRRGAAQLIRDGRQQAARRTDR
jgi:hypothetical protein